jgi:hypothetical protein
MGPCVRRDDGGGCCWIDIKAIIARSTCDEAIHSSFARRDGLLPPSLASYGGQVVATLLAMTLIDIRSSSRGAMRPEFCKSFAPRKSEGAGKTGCALHPRSRVQICAKKTHTSIQVQRRQSGLPRAMVLRLISRSPRRRIRLVTVIGGLAILPNPVGLAKPPPT